ncbi:MAG TPA: hypothetical protein DCZ95_11330 [Verrucomicrobia bacterium]|nr:MAG: hypothetical protein A2X46_04265 [Lentisphaerae bacterium GWF2_57_35]HBA84677.1 hypothetical protein [Verrucomicrobiota bacterium]
MVLIALAITSGLYGWIGARAARSLRSVADELCSVRPHIESVANAELPRRAVDVDRAISNMAPALRVLLPVLSRSEKHLSTRGLSHTALYSHVSQILKDIMDFNRKRKLRDADWALGHLKTIRDDASALESICRSL